MARPRGRAPANHAGGGEDGGGRGPDRPDGHGNGGGGEPRYTIGRLAELTGVRVKTIRFYSDSGILPPAGRSASGYRLYGDADRARLELIRSLRDVGLDLDTIRRVVERDLAPDDAARLQLEAVEAQLRALTRVRAVLRFSLRHGDASAAHLERLHQLARLTAADRERLIDGFLEGASAGIPQQGWEAGAELRRLAVPDLPDDPTVAQLDAWLELATLARDADFQERLRAGAAAFWEQVPDGFDLDAWHTALAGVRSGMLALVADEVPPDDPRAAAVVERFAAAAATAFGRRDSPGFRAALLREYEAHTDPRASRYWELVATINGWGEPGPEIAANAWLLDAFRHAVERDREPGEDPAPQP